MYERSECYVCMNEVNESLNLFQRPLNSIYSLFYRAQYPQNTSLDS